MNLNTIYNEDCRETMRRMPDGFVDCIVTSPPYFGLRDYGVNGQIGAEGNPNLFVEALTNVFREAHRILKPTGTLWLNLGDSYAGAGYSNHKGTGGAKREQGGKQRHLSGTGLKNKDLIGAPWRVALSLQADGWYLRQDIIWHKPNPMPESVRDRCVKSHEYIFLFSKSLKYFFDHIAIQEPTVKGGDKRNKRSVWSVPTKAFKGAHFATFPPDLIEPCIISGCPIGGVVYDPFTGAATTGVVALRNGRAFIGSEINPRYVQMGNSRIQTTKTLV